jgi:glycosyltransferase involved in cell wall biosynthesis
VRIACLSSDPGIAWGGAKGASVHLAEIVEALRGEGVQVLVLVSGIAPEAPAPASGVTLESLPGPRKGIRVDALLAGEGELAAWLVDRLRTFGADALYERIALHSAAGSVAARTLGIPHLVELNAPLPEEAARYRRLDRPDDAARLERETLAGAGLVLPVSSPLATYARDRGAQWVEVAPNAVVPERFADLPARQPSAPPLAVFSGALRPWHGIETIAEAWGILGAAAPRLRVIGDGPAREVVAAAGAEMLGAVPHEQVPRLLGEADIGLAPYSPDAPAYFSPLKLFEYLAAGLAVVAADIPGVRDVTGDEAAVLIPPGDAPALARAVAHLADDHLERDRLGAAARALAAEHTWQRRGQRIIDAVRELSAAEPAAR